jgi:hypothetical protein
LYLSAGNDLINLRQGYSLMFKKIFAPLQGYVL